jgi:hypothetical protein
MTTPRTYRPAGCYGFRIEGVPDAADLLTAAPPDWPELRLEHASAAASEAPREDRLGPDRALLTMHGGWMAIDRSPARATFHLPEAPPDRDLVHPYLAPAAAVAARWAGRESFHAGAVLAGDGAWAVLGDKESGKSTTLAWLAATGLPVLSDDLLVVDGESALAGPRCVDLREASAARLGTGEPLGVVGVRERWRVGLGPVPPRAPLRGWVTLAWSDEIGVDTLRGPERMLALMPFRSVRVSPERPADLIALSGLPVLRLRRPRRWERLDEAARRLLGAIAG